MPLHPRRRHAHQMAGSWAIHGWRRAGRNVAGPLDQPLELARCGCRICPAEATDRDHGLSGGQRDRVCGPGIRGCDEEASAVTVRAQVWDQQREAAAGRQRSRVRVCGDGSLFDHEGSRDRVIAGLCAVDRCDRVRGRAGEQRDRGGAHRKPDRRRPRTTRAGAARSPRRPQRSRTRIPPIAARAEIRPRGRAARSSAR